LKTKASEKAGAFFVCNAWLVEGLCLQIHLTPFLF
jgi:hypothetical protein